MAQPQFRIGHGYDLHRMEPLKQTAFMHVEGEHLPRVRPRLDQPVRPLVLAGVPLEHDRGVVAHSDGDALYHAATDAILGALARPDIGQLFPDTDPRHDAENSEVYFARAVEVAKEMGYRVSNFDGTVILQAPKLSPNKDAMRANLARVMGVPLDCVNVKGKTHEKVDAVGENRAIEVHCVVMLERVG